MNLCAENGHDLGADGRWRDLDDLSIPAGDEAALATINGAASAVLNRAAAPLTSTWWATTLVPTFFS